MNGTILKFPNFSSGQIVLHKLFNYRGVIFGVDTSFQGSNEWYEQATPNRPPKIRPWYHILVDNAVHTTYASEVNLVECPLKIPVDHPMIHEFFNSFNGNRYQLLKETRLGQIKSLIPLS